MENRTRNYCFSFKESNEHMEYLKNLSFEIIKYENFIISNETVYSLIIFKEIKTTSVALKIISNKGIFAVIDIKQLNSKVETYTLISQYKGNNTFWEKGMSYKNSVDKIEKTKKQEILEKEKKERKEQEKKAKQEKIETEKREKKERKEQEKREKQELKEIQKRETKNNTFDDNACVTRLIEYFTPIIQDLSNARVNIQNIQNNTQNIQNNTQNIKKFNLNVFLNQDCKNAITIQEFIDNMQITKDDVHSNLDRSMADMAIKLISTELQKYDIYTRPIHCTDAKREVLHIKENEGWIKENGTDSKNMKRVITWLNHKKLCTVNDVLNEKEFKNLEEEHRYRSVAIGNFYDADQKKVIREVSKEVYLSDPPSQ